MGKTWKKELSIKVGNKTSVKRGLFDYLEIRYTGMPKDDTYSLSFDLYGPNVYFPIDHKRIEVQKGYLNVLHVNPEEIILEYVKEE